MNILDILLEAEKSSKKQNIITADDGKDDDSVDYTEDIEQDDDTDVSDEETNEEDNADDETEETDDTDTSDEDSTDYTAEISEDEPTDGEDDGTGDEEETSDGSDDTTDDTSNEPEGTPEEKARYAALLSDFIEFYYNIKDNVGKLDKMINIDIISNKIIIRVKKNFITISEYIYEYITNKYQSKSYAHSIYIFNYLVENYKINVEMLRKMSVFSGSNKTNN